MAFRLPLAVGCTVTFPDGKTMLASDCAPELTANKHLSCTVRRKYQVVSARWISEITHITVEEEKR